MKLEEIVKLVLRANKAGRPPVESWKEDTSEEDDARGFMEQLAAGLGAPVQNVMNVAFPPTIRVQSWCDTYGCETQSMLFSAPRNKDQWAEVACSGCGCKIQMAAVESYVYVHPNLFDVWTLESPSLDAAGAKFAMQWDKECSHLTGSGFDQGKFMLADDYEASK